MVCPTYSAKPMREPDAATFGGLDLIASKSEALARLGFSGPAWVSADPSSAEATCVTAHAVYRNEKTNVVAWVGPTIDISRPNQLLVYYTTLLQDGRYALTQVVDPYFETVNDPQTPARTIASSDEASELALHQAFVAELGVPAAKSTPRDDVLRFAGEHMNGIRSRLLERGLIREAAGVARPSLSFAIRLLKSFASRPKATGNPDVPVPTARLGFLANVAELAKDRAPSQGMQWLLLAMSVALFICIGWPLLGVEFTLIVLGVILFHEGGHWIAMRSFGYGNPHITLLPLLGGVTIGHENDPSAGKRAWVALAGPLPGILLGWTLVYFVGFGPIDLLGENTGWVLPTSIVLLFVNYLNILPIPPFDGSHIVQAILPPRWVGLQVVFLLVGVALGVYVAYLLEFWPIALISALQLLGLKSLLQTTRLVAELKTVPIPFDQDESARRTWVFEQMAQRLGAPEADVGRIGLSNRILHQLTVQPMGWIQRFAVSGIYGALLVVPVTGLLLWSTDPWTADAPPEVERMYDEFEGEWEQLASRAQELEMTELLSDLSENSPEAPPASPTALAAAGERLGRSVPDHLAEFYALNDGALQSTGIGPVEEIRQVDLGAFATGDLQYYAYEGQLYFYEHSLGEIIVPIADMKDWWIIGNAEDYLSIVLIDPKAGTGDAAVFAISEGDMSAFKTTRDLLRSHWVGRQSQAVYAANSERVRAMLSERMQDMSVSELLGEFREPALIERLLTRQFGHPGSIEAGSLAATEDRIGRSLPDDHVEVLQIHNGFEPMALLPGEDIRPGSESVEFNIERAVEIAHESGRADITAEDIAACWVVAGRMRDRNENEPEELFATLFWCPELDSEHQYLSIAHSRFQESFTEALRHHAVSMSGY
jgi:Zn-dependent protease